MNLSEPVLLIALLALLSAVPVLIFTGTAFIKIAIVLSLVRNAIGVQQVPSNLTLHSFALILTLFVMGPVIFDIQEKIEPGRLTTDTAYLGDVLAVSSTIYGRFLTANTAPESRRFFQDSIRTLWPEKYQPSADTPPLYILIPAFTLSELTSAFKIGFLLYLPFLAIDFVVSNILLAMGMMMVSPMTLSLPLKLLLFISVNGWEKLTHALLFSYHFT